MATGWRGQYYRYKDFFLNILSLYKQRKDIRAFLELVLSLSTIIIFVVFALKPTALTIINLYNQIKDKRATLTSLNQKISDLQTANGIFNQNQSLIPYVNTAVSNNPHPDDISKQILGAASKNNVNLLGISIGQLMISGKNAAPKSQTGIKPLPENAQTMPISINTKGNYSDLLSFIKNIENLRIPVRVDSLTINSSQTQEGNTIVSIITARIPYLGQQ